jgi:hypothetical protein
MLRSVRETLGMLFARPMVNSGRYATCISTIRPGRFATWWWTQVAGFRASGRSFRRFASDGLIGNSTPFQ